MGILKIILDLPSMKNGTNFILSVIMFVELELNTHSKDECIHSKAKIDSQMLDFLLCNRIFFKGIITFTKS